MASTTVTAKYLEPDGVTPCNGRVRFRLVAATYHDGLDAIFPVTPITAVLSAGGTLSVSLEPTSGASAHFDSPNMMYEVTETIQGAERAPYYVDVPTVGSVDLGTLVTYDQPPFVVRELVVPDLNTLGMSSDAEVAAARLLLPYNVKDYGVTGNGTTDDTAAIQALIDTLDTAVGAGGASIYFPAGEYVISSTITFTKFSGKVYGDGAGISPAYTPGPGHNTVIRWNGNNTTPMIQVKDCQLLKISDLRLEGKDSSRPTYGIDFHNLTADTSGSNQYLKVEDVYIGQFPWSSQGTNVGRVGICVGFTGDNVNNDQFSLVRCQFMYPTTVGVYIPNSQSVWGSITDCELGYCTKGIQTSASVSLINPMFNGSSVVDIEADGSAKVQVSSWNSEGAVKFGTILSSASIFARGGVWLPNAVGAGNFVTVQYCGGSSGIALDSIGCTADIKMNVAAAGGYGPTNPGVCRVINSPTSLASLTVTSAASDAVHVVVSNAKLNIDTMIQQGETLSTQNFEVGANAGIGGRLYSGTGSPESVVAGRIGSVYLRTDGGANTSMYVKESNNNGTTGWTAK